MRTLTELNTLILGWAAERQILKNSTPFAQAKKTAEEVMELIQADKWYHVETERAEDRLKHCTQDGPEFNTGVALALEDIKDAIGDIYVTLVVGLGCCEERTVLADEEVATRITDSSDDNVLKQLVSTVLPNFYHYARTHTTGFVYPSVVVDVMRYLAAIAHHYSMTLPECVEAAYEQIKDRKGYLREDGVFVKETT